MNTRACAIALLLVASPLVTCVAQDQDVETGAQDESAEPLPKLPADKLPPATRPKPDPEKVQFIREPVHVEVRETRVGSDGKSSTPEVRVVENYMKEYFRRAGHPVVESSQDAEYRIRATVESQYNRAIRFRDQVIAHRVRGTAEIVVEDSEQKELERFAVPETYQEAALEEDRAFLTLQRYIAHLLWSHVFQRGSTFADPAIRDLLSTLTIQNQGDSQPPTTEEIVEKLADRGLEAVPYLLEALSDTNTVQIPSHYPGLEETGPDALKVFHIADKALEEIFQKVSRLPLEAPPRVRFLVTKAWEAEWRRFCKSYRESPASRGERNESERDGDTPGATSR